MTCGLLMLIPNLSCAINIQVKVVIVETTFNIGVGLDAYKLISFKLGMVIVTIKLNTLMPFSSSSYSAFPTYIFGAHQFGEIFVYLTVICFCLIQP